MSVRRSKTAWLAALAVGAASAALAQELGPESFSTGFEQEAGYTAGDPIPGQPGDWPEQWYSWYGDENAVVSTALAHGGSQSAAFPVTFTDIQHLGMLDTDPDSFPPVIWEESFSFYVSNGRVNAAAALRSEPWNNWPGQGYSYQLFLWQVGGNGFSADFEEYEPGNLPGQIGWYSFYGPDDEAAVSTAQAHSGSKSVAFPVGFTDAQHIGMSDADPYMFPPVIWEEKFSVFVPGDLPDGAIALRAEPWNNWPDTGFSYQFFIFRVDDGLTNGWVPQIGWSPLDNDLRDEMGMDPLFDSFATGKWWNVTIIADGENGIVTSVTITDDFGASFEATGLSDPFSTWGNDLTDNDPPGETYTGRPERVSYYSEGGGVFLDDVSVNELGVPLVNGWWPELGWGVNDLRDEMGMGPDDLFASDKWWNVTIVADGENGIVTSVSVSDDQGANYQADGLSEPFSVWGAPLDVWAQRPERVSYYSEGGGVFLDDIGVAVAGQCTGDLDGDGDTDQSDLGVLLADWGCTGGGCSGDLDGDGDTDQSDLGILLADWGCGT